MQNREFATSTEIGSSITPVSKAQRLAFDIDPNRVRRAKRKLDLGLLDQPEVVDRAVNELLTQYFAGKLDLVSIDGDLIDD